MAEIESIVTRGLSKEEIDDFQEAFDNFDRDGNGFIEKNELAIALRSLGYTPTSSQLAKLMTKVDLDGNGRISFDEFVMMMRLGGMETDFEKEIKDAFNFFDLNGDGVVDRSEMGEIMRGLGNKLSDEEILLIINAADLDKDGRISMKEFMTFMFN